MKFVIEFELLGHKFRTNIPAKNETEARLKLNEWLLKKLTVKTVRPATLMDNPEISKTMNDITDILGMPRFKK